MMPKEMSRLVAANKADGVAADASKGAGAARVKSKEPIPLSKTPKRQRSSRFHIAERVELEKLVGFNGGTLLVWPYNSTPRLTRLPVCVARQDVGANDRNDLLLKKILQCKVLFDFSDPLSDMKGKEIKRQTLTELVEYVGTSRGAIGETAHLELINMVEI
jgi:serine/threonine-protein phosphatase 2A regulatory subunit B'